MPSGRALIQEPNRAIASYIGDEAGEFPEQEKSSMDQASWWIIDILGPAILLLVLIWLVMRRRSSGTSADTEAGTRGVYAEEEQRRREGTDDL